MSPRTRDAVIERVLMGEGGLSDHPDDRGALTNFGLTRGFLETVTQRAWTDQQIRDLSKQTAKDVYALWMTIRRLDKLPDDEEFAFTVTDYAVHSGERAAIKALQRAMGIAVDGIAGTDTQAAWHRLDFRQREKARKDVIAQRLEHVGRIVRSDPKQAAFILGWLRRIAEQVRV